MSNNQVLYEELRPAAFVEKVNAFPVAYLPLGTLEWHGLHLPIGSDGIQSKGVFERLAAEIGGVVLPMLFLGPDSVVKGSEAAREHQNLNAYPSAIAEKDEAVFIGMDHHSFEKGAPQQLEGSAYYVDEDFFNTLLDNVLRNLARAGIKVVVGHGHGPSTNAFHQGKRRFEEVFGLQTFTLWELGEQGPRGIQSDHAATNETSLVMALRPDLADISQLSADETPVGVWGDDPRVHASAELGEAIIARNVQLAADKLRKLVANLPHPRRALDYERVTSLLNETT
jgi:creatinine amidohydrolase